MRRNTMARGQNDDHDNNCYFDTPTKAQILDKLSSVQDQLSRKREFDDLALKVRDVIHKLQGGDFANLT
jgi:hypothetical protein